MPLDPEFWTQTLNSVVAGILTFLPRLAGALALLILGWLLARIVRFALTGVLRRLGVDRLADRAGATQILTEAGLDPSAAHLFARLIYWLVLLVFVLAAAESLGLPGVADTFSGLLAYLPNVLAAAVILLIGSLVARVAGDAVGALATQAGAGAGALVGQAVRYVLMVFALILAVEQLGVETLLLVTVALALITATVLALAIAFGLGSRELARNIMAGFHAREEFGEGQLLTVRGHTGRLESIGPVKSTLKTEDGSLSVPNLALVEEEVGIGAQAGDPVDA